MSHEEFLESLKDPFSKVSRKIRIIKSLKRKISTLNARYMRSGDYIQSKNGFKNKVKDVVLVPKTLFFTTKPSELAPILPKLDEFVMKPNHLSRGLGVRVLKRDGSKYIDLNGDILTIDELIEEAEAIMKVRRGMDCNRGVMIEKCIHSHEDFQEFMCGTGVADIRMVFFDKELIFGIGRFPSEESGGYGNIRRGAKWGVFNEYGDFVNDPKFLKADIQEGTLPLFAIMLQASQKAIQEYQFPFQSIDLTVNDKGEAVVIESEKSPQIEAYFTKEGGAWLYKKILMGLTRK